MEQEIHDRKWQKAEHARFKMKVFLCFEPSSVSLLSHSEVRCSAQGHAHGMKVVWIWSWLWTLNCKSLSYHHALILECLYVASSWATNSSFCFCSNLIPQLPGISQVPVYTTAQLQNDISLKLRREPRLAWKVNLRQLQRVNRQSV